jgi:hypothetical protein
MLPTLVVALGFLHLHSPRRLHHFSKPHLIAYVLALRQRLSSEHRYSPLQIQQFQRFKPHGPVLDMSSSSAFGLQDDAGLDRISQEDNPKAGEASLG